MTSKEQKQAEKLLQRNGIGFHDIGSFRFMKRYYQMPRKSNLISKDKYGAGVLTLHLNKGTNKSDLPSFISPSNSRYPLFVIPGNTFRELIKQEKEKQG